MLTSASLAHALPAISSLPGSTTLVERHSALKTRALAALSPALVPLAATIPDLCPWQRPHRTLATVRATPLSAVKLGSQRNVVPWSKAARRELGALARAQCLRSLAMGSGQAIGSGAGAIDVTVAVAIDGARTAGLAAPLVGAARSVVSRTVLGGKTLNTATQLFGGRGGAKVKNLVGPKNSVVRGSGERLFVTNEKGQVVLDIAKDRVKPVTPGRGFGPKRGLTEEELGLLDKIFARE